MPKQKPLQRLNILQRVREAKYTVFIVGGVEVNQNRARFEDGQRRGLVSIDDDGDTPCSGTNQKGWGNTL